MKFPTFDDSNFVPVPRVPEWPVYEPEALPENWRLIAEKYEDRDGEDYNWQFYYDGAMLIIYDWKDDINQFDNTPIRLIEQYEFPIEGARWFVENIKRFFLKSGEPGALEAHKFSLDDSCGEESLGISRLVHTYGPGIPGYSFNNLSRCGHPNRDLCQRFEMSDDFLFKKDGMLALFAEIAERYESGEFDSLAKT